MTRDRRARKPNEGGGGGGGRRGPRPTNGSGGRPRAARERAGNGAPGAAAAAEQPASRRPHRGRLYEIARAAMRSWGFQADYSREALREIAALPEHPPEDGRADLRELLWSSIDNDDSLDLDQLTVAEPLGGGLTRISIAVADVSAYVPRGSAIDDHALANTTSIYTPPANFPMLPDRLSTDLTSLVQDQDRAAVVVHIVLDESGAVKEESLERALVRNRAKLAYPSVGAWLDGSAEPPPALAAVPGLDENLKIQDTLARTLDARREEQGALELDREEWRAHFEDDRVVDLQTVHRTRARDLIENFMIAANGAVARFLERHKLPVVRRIVRVPARWPRIVEVAAELGTKLPAAPDSKALNEFLMERRKLDPVTFPDLSLTIVKLLGSGEYVATFPGEPPIGHFGLAARQYTHSTAPNRRYPDIITQRMLTSALTRAKNPYRPDDLTVLAQHCTKKEDDAQKVERRVRKSTAAAMLQDRIGETFEGVVTGASEKGTWVRVFRPPVEGRVERGWHGLDVGDRVRVRLLSADVERGFIDFENIGRGRIAEKQ